MVLAVCIFCKPPTSPLLHRDMGEPEGGEEALLVLQLGRLVHLLGREAGAERRWRRCALGLRHGGRRAALPEHPPPFSPLLLHQLVMSAPSRQAKQRDKVQFLCPPQKTMKGNKKRRGERKTRGLVSCRVHLCLAPSQAAGVVCASAGRCCTSVESSNLRGGCSATLRR